MSFRIHVERDARLPVDTRTLSCWHDSGGFNQILTTPDNRIFWRFTPNSYADATVVEIRRDR